MAKWYNAAKHASVKLKDLVLFLSLRLLGHSDYFENGSCETLHTWCRSRQILGCEGFLPEFSRKVFVWLLPTNFFSQRLWRPVCEDHTSLVWPANKVFICFFGFGEKKSNIGRHFCQDFQGFFPDLRQIKIFGVRFHPLHPRLLHHCLVLPLTSNSRPSGETSRWPRLACQHCKIYERDRVASGLWSIPKPISCHPDLVICLRSECEHTFIFSF